MRPATPKRSAALREDGTRRAAGIRLSLALAVDHPGWLALVGSPAPLLRRAARAALGVAPRSRGRKDASFEVGVALIDDRAMRKLNRTFRGRDKSTNVLSFPAAAPMARIGGRRALGDVALALGTVRREALAQKKPPKEHLAHLMVHAVLHLLGYDHEDDADAERMEGLERKALSRLGVPDPYRPRVGQG